MAEVAVCLPGPRRRADAAIRLGSRRIGAPSGRKVDEKRAKSGRKVRLSPGASRPRLRARRSAPSPPSANFCRKADEKEAFRAAPSRLRRPTFWSGAPRPRPRRAGGGPVRRARFRRPPVARLLPRLCGSLCRAGRGVGSHPKDEKKNCGVEEGKNRAAGIAGTGSPRHGLRRAPTRRPDPSENIKGSDALPAERAFQIPADLHQGHGMVWGRRRRDGTRRRGAA